MSLDNLTYLDSKDWVRKPVPQEALDYVLQILGSPSGIYPLRFKGDIQVDYKVELTPHPKNPDLMNTARFQIFTGAFEVVLKTYKNGKEKTYPVRYQIFSRIDEVLEVGGYYDRRS